MRYKLKVVNVRPVVMLSITFLQVPKEYTVEFIMMAGDTITNTLMLYGEVLRAHYGKDHSYRKADLSINYLG